MDPAKVRDYLLSPEHPVGRLKAVVFRAAGYRREAWHVLRADLAATAHLPAALDPPSAFGQGYRVSAILKGPARRELAVTVLWFVRTGEDFARLVTAYPRVRQ